MVRKIQLECAVLVYDDFSDKIISGSAIKVTAVGVSSSDIVRKPDGFFLIMKGEHPLKEIKIEGPTYITEDIAVNTKDLNRKDPVIKLRAKPNYRYPFPSGTTGLRGTLKRNEKLDLICLNGLNNIAMLAEYSAEMFIQLFAAKNENLEGKILAILGKGETVPELFQVLQEDSVQKGRYQLEKPLSKKYKKVGTKVYRVYCGIGDEKGTYILPIKNEFMETCKFMISKNETTWETLEIPVGEITKIDF